LDDLPAGGGLQEVAEGKDSQPYFNLSRVERDSILRQLELNCALRGCNLNLRLSALEVDCMNTAAVLLSPARSASRLARPQSREGDADREKVSELKAWNMQARRGKSFLVTINREPKFIR